VAIGPWRRHTRHLAYENDWITVWHDVVTRPDGGAGIYGLVHFANLADMLLKYADVEPFTAVRDYLAAWPQNRGAER